MITKKGSTKVVNFMTPGAGVFVLGHGHISHIHKFHFYAPEIKYCFCHSVILSSSLKL